MMLRSPKFRKKDPRFAFHAVPLDMQLKGIKNSITSLALTDSDMETLLWEVARRFTIRYYNASKYLKTPYSINEFVVASKRRSDELSKMVYSCIQARELDVKLFVQRNNKGKIRTYKYKYENNLEIIDNDDEDFLVYQQTVNPKSYSDLFRAAYTIIHNWTAMIEYYPDLDNEIIRSLNFLITISRMYENLRGNQNFNLQQEYDSIATMTSHFEPDKTSSDWNDIMSTIDEIAEYVNDSALKVPPLYRQIVNAIRATKLSPYSEGDYHYSFRSTGLSRKGIRGKVPALFASLVETGSSHPNDELIGYTNHYKKNLHEDFHEDKDHTLSIEQSKVKRRVIHITDNQTQDRCNYFHNVLSGILRRMRTDCTFNQYDGVEFALRVTDERYIERNMNNIYCTDLSDATGNISQQYQEIVLALVFGPELASWYMEMVTRPKIFKHVDRSITHFQQTMGQPQGYKGSFPAFALAHHIIVLASLRGTIGTNNRSDDIYRIVGDDIIMSLPDRNQIFLTDFQNKNKAVNLILHDVHTKGNIFLYGQDSVATAEFAKVTVVNGKVCTPFPIKLVIKNDGSLQSALQLISWDAHNNQPRTMDDVIYTLKRIASDKNNLINDEDFVNYLRYSSNLKVSSLLSIFESDIEVPEVEKVMIAFSVLDSMLYQACLDQLLPDHLRESGNERTINAFIDINWEEEFLTTVPNDHKYVLALQANQSIIDAIEDIYPDKPMLSRAVIALGLTPSDFNTIYSIVDVLRHDPSVYIGQGDYLINLVGRLQEVIEEFSLRSYVKRRKVESALFVSAYYKYIQHCKKSGLFD